MMPTAPGHPTFAEVDADPLGVNARLGTYTNFVNLLGWCASGAASGLRRRRPALRRHLHRAGRLRCGARPLRPALAAQRLQLALGATGARAAARHARPRRWPASETTLPIAVVGAHLSRPAAQRQLVERGATLQATTHTAPRYRLYALPGTVPPKPGLVRTAEGGAAIAVEVWDMPLIRRRRVSCARSRRRSASAAWSSPTGGACTASSAKPTPPRAPTDITAYGGWRDYLQQRASSSPATASPRSVP